MWIISCVTAGTTRNASLRYETRKEWLLDFVFQTTVKLSENPVERILAVDLGLNSACTCSVMDAEGTVLGREFLSLPREYDSLSHAISHIKHAQKLCAGRTPRLWAQAKGINDDIAVKTAPVHCGYGSQI